MLKNPNSLKDVEWRAAEELKALFAQVPSVKVDDIVLEPSTSDSGIDFIATATAFKRRHSLVCEVKSYGQPRFVRNAVLQLRNYVAHHKGEATLVVIAPYLSPEAQALCKEAGVGFLDFEGNARIAFDGVFIERTAGTKPAAEKRELRSLFKPKSAQVLRVLLRKPNRAWRVAQLAEAADVSLGHVSNVRVTLVNREWAQISDEGLSLSEPGLLLDAWRDAYDGPGGDRLGFYTVLHGSSFEDAARRVLQTNPARASAALASFSAAQWLAPYARTSTHFFYADEIGLKRLKEALKLSSATKGENVTVIVPQDTGVLSDIVEPVAGAVCTSPVQTYLDLTKAGERGREAADHLREELLKWPR